MVKQPAITGLGLMCAWLVLHPLAAFGQSTLPAPTNFRVVGPLTPPSPPSPPPPSPPSPSPPPPPPPDVSPSDISVLSWNIRVDDYSEAHARAAMAAAVAVSPRPQIILVQEAYNTRYSIYLDELRRQTGTTWYGAFAMSCPSGSWNGSSCTGNTDGGIGIFSSFPIVDTSTIQFPFPDCWTSTRPALRAAVNVNGRVVQVFNTHLQTGSCSDVAQQRYSSMNMLKNWAGNFATPQLLGGDFNADADQIMSAQGMTPNFVDSWAAVSGGNGFTYPIPSPWAKLDYLMFDRSGTARPLTSAVVTSTGSTSDHYPVRTTFRIQ
jgi:endonuclease/exonuclease/phosphatase family metal-dependent hydrolase